MSLRGNLIKSKLASVTHWKLCFSFNEEDAMYLLELKLTIHEGSIELSRCVCFDMCSEVVPLFSLDYFCVFLNPAGITKVKDKIKNT